MEITPTQFADSKFASKRESFAILQELATFRNNEAVDFQPPAETVAIDISLRRGRIALCTVGMVSIIAALVLFFRKGYEIRHYEKAELNSTTQKKLLDDYNSYSGNIASVFGKPIELFVPACIQVIMLRFLPNSLLRNEPSWKAASMVLAVSAGVGYLISNGFNALNVQLVDSAIHPKIKATDLSRDDALTTAGIDWMVRTTSISNSMPESQDSNPITNTVLRSLVLPRAIRTKSSCASSSTYQIMTEHLALETVEYGFPKRDWMKQLLPEALSVQSLQLMLNATNKSANKGLKAQDLPMNASIASNLVLTAMILSKDFIPLIGDWYDPNGNSYKKSKVASAVRVGILPNNLSTSDAEQKKWFLDHVGDFMTTAFNTTTNMTLSNIPMNFSHVAVAPNISFDAVTLEIDVEPLLLANFVNQKTGDRYMNAALERASFSDDGPSFSCDPWPARCIFQKKDPELKSDTIKDDIHYDQPHQIQAFSICLNSNGTELMESMLGSYLAFSINPEQCSRMSTTSILLVSVGKRLVVDQLIQNATANATGVYPGSGDVAVNVRKIYSFTVGRLSWNTSSLAEQFGAECDAGEGENCEGLSVKLTPTASGGVPTPPQWLVASTASLPMDALMQPVLNSGDYRHSRIQRPLTLVQVNEPPRQPQTLYWYDVAAGDILHPHNVRNLTWDLSRNRPRWMCAVEEERVQRVLDNHMYIEHPLQATYTAAVFFLLQDAVVKNAVVVKRGSTSVTTLAFDGNEQRVALVVSIPTDNAALTLMGCIILSIGVALSLAWTTMVTRLPGRQNPLSGITNAEVIARAKLDDKTFPGFFLDRRIVSGSDKTGAPRVLDTLVINSLSLQPTIVPLSLSEPQATKDFAASKASQIVTRLRQIVVAAAAATIAYRKRTWRDFAPRSLQPGASYIVHSTCAPVYRALGGGSCSTQTDLAWPRPVPRADPHHSAILHRPTHPHPHARHDADHRDHTEGSVPRPRRRSWHREDACDQRTLVVPDQRRPRRRGGTDCLTDKYSMLLNATLINDALVGVGGTGAMNLSVYYQQDYMGQAISTDSSVGLPRGATTMMLRLDLFKTTAVMDTMHKMVNALIASKPVQFFITGNHPYATQAVLLKGAFDALNISMVYTDGLKKMDYNKQQCNIAEMLG